MKKIKILHIQLQTLLSGVQNVMLQLLDLLPKDKFDIYVACQPTGPLVDEIKKRGFTHIPLKYIRRNLTPLDILAFIELFLMIKKYRFDIVHTHVSKTGFWGRIAARLAGVHKIIHTHHGVPYHQNQFFLARGLYMLSEMIASRFCDYVVFMNNDEYELSIKYHLVARNKAKIIYNGFPVKEIETNSPKKASDKFVIGNVARFEKQKNHKTMIDVAIETCKRNKDINFIFVGNGSFYEKLNKKVNMLGLSNRIQLVGWQKDSKVWYKKFDVYLMFTLWEGMPLAILEAMNHSLPIVASDIPGNRELVRKENGFLVSSKDKDKLVDLLTKLPQMKDKLNTMGEKSLEILKKDFNLKKFYLSYMDLYND